MTTIDREKFLVHLRADPSKVRVSIRRTDYDLYRASVKSLEDGFEVTCHCANPSRAVDEALVAAQNRYRMNGIDLDCKWTYIHPQRKLG
jgi:hypothetical protein